MKKTIMFTLMLAALSPLCLFALEPVEYVNDDMGYSYLKINQDLNDFSFKSDFKSVGNSGKVGVFKYTAGLEGQALKDYIAQYDANDARFSKHENNGMVSLGDVKAGDRYGFYLLRNNNDIVRVWDFQYKHGDLYIAFDKNGDHGQDEWIRVGEVNYNNPSGAPLPGAIPVLIVGAVGAMIANRKKKTA